MKKISLLLLFAILLMAAACMPAVRMVGENQEPLDRLEADSSPEEFVDFRRFLQGAGDRFQKLLPENFPQRDLQASGQAARDLLLDAQSKARAYLRLAGSWIRIREMVLPLIETAGDHRDSALEWWNQHKDEVENFLLRFNLDQEQWDLYKESALEVLDDLDNGVLQEAGAEWAGQIQDFVERLEIDWGSLPDLSSP